MNTKLAWLDGDVVVLPMRKGSGADVERFEIPTAELREPEGIKRWFDKLEAEDWFGPAQACEFAEVVEQLVQEP